MTEVEGRQGQVFSFKSQQSQQELAIIFTHGIRLEVAQDVLGVLLAHWSEAAACALDAANSDPGRLTKIEAEQRKLRNLRHDLDPRDAEQSESVIAEHALLARRLYATA